MRPASFAFVYMRPTVPLTRYPTRLGICYACVFVISRKTNLSIYALTCINKDGDEI